MKMRKAICVLLVLAVACSLAACGAKNAQSAQDDSPVTMFITLGNSEKYYRALAETIENDLGIDVEFVYQVNADTTDTLRLCFANNDLPADIVFTASKTKDELLKDSCVDLLSNSSVASLFTHSTIQECTTEDGAVYQLPVSSKLIGITYNETLMNEMGWAVPESFQDMLDLKAKCDEAGIKFAVTDGAATGHGFNWLFHLMGTQWISTFEGTEWFEGFQKGTRTVDDFMEQCDYFRRWTETGLWGSIHNQDWGGSTEFSQTRALFWFGLTNSATGYDGPEYDDNGNETGRELHDTYKSMPWISEDGSNNCYTYYDNCWVYINKELEAPEKSEKLKKAIQIIEFMASGEATKLVSDMASDTYVSVNNYVMGDDRIYAAYNESVKTGFLQPWYYNEFDMDSIVFTGEAVNNYLLGEGSFENIFTVLDERNQNMLNSRIEILADFPEGLGYEDTAKLTALSCVEAINLTLEENGRTERVEVAIAPYTPGDNLLQPWKNCAVSNTIVYKGEFDAAMTRVLIPGAQTNSIAIRMTGAQIKSIVEKGFDPSDRFIDANTGESTFDSEHYGPYPYVCLVKDGAELEDSREYLVALCDGFLTLADYNAFSEAGKLLSDLTGIHTVEQGLRLFAQAHPKIIPADLVF